MGLSSTQSPNVYIFCWWDYPHSEMTNISLRAPLPLIWAMRQMNHWQFPSTSTTVLIDCPPLRFQGLSLCWWDFSYSEMIADPLCWWDCPPLRVLLVRCSADKSPIRRWLRTHSTDGIVSHSDSKPSLHWLDYLHSKTTAALLCWWDCPPLRVQSLPLCWWDYPYSEMTVDQLY